MLCPTFKTITKRSYKTSSALGRSPAEFAVPEGWADSAVPPPRSCSPCLHHLSRDPADKVNQPVTWGGGGLTEDALQLRCQHSQSFLPAPSRHPESQRKVLPYNHADFSSHLFFLCGGTSIYVTRFLEGFPALLQIGSTGMRFLGRFLSSCTVSSYAKSRKGHFLNKDFSLIVS